MSCQLVNNGRGGRQEEEEECGDGGVSLSRAMSGAVDEAEAYSTSAGVTSLPGHLTETPSTHKMHVNRKP